MKKKLLFVLGIVILICGIGIFMYPIITQAITAHQQKVLMQEVKKEILNNILDTNTDIPEEITNTPTQEASAVQNTDVSPDDSGEDISSEDAPETATPTPSYDNILAELEEEDTVEEVSLDKSKLAGQKCVGIISIEDIGIVYAIAEGVEKSQIAVAIGHFSDSVGIGKEGNCALAGHSGGHLGKYFKDIHKLKIGAKIVLTDLKGTEYTYNVTESFVCNPTDYYVVQDLGVEGKYLTLVTCTENGTKRWIIRAQCTEEPTTLKGTRK